MSMRALDTEENEMFLSFAAYEKNSVSLVSLASMTSSRSVPVVAMTGILFLLCL